MKVRALQMGFYGNSRKRPGTVFEIKGKAELGRWMEVVEDDDDPKPAKTQKAKAAKPEPEPKPPVSTGDQDVI